MSDVDDLEAKLAEAKVKLYDETSPKFPKWVLVHKTQVYDGPDGLPKTAWPQTHQDREGNVTVLVQNEDEEAQAQAEAKPATVESPDQPPAENDPNAKDTAQ